MKKFSLCFSNLIVLFCCVSLCTSAAFSQTDASGTAPKKIVKKPVPPVVSSSNKSAKKPPQGRQTKRTIPPASRLGVIAITVTEADTEIFLDGPAGSSVLDAESIFVSPGATYFLRDLKPATYVVTARKPGFSEHTRSLTIAAGKTYPIEIFLKSAMNFLTVTTGLEDATIDIDGVGTYRGSVRNLPVKPGVYSVTVRRLGYISETKSVTLADPPSSSAQHIAPRPVPIDSMLAEASRKIDAGDYPGALVLAEQVLAFDASHGTANYRAGLACFSMGDARSSGFFLRSIRAGQTISIPASLLVKASGGLSIVQVSLYFDSNYFSVRSSTKAEHNFSIFKPDLERSLAKLDRSSEPYIDLEGKGESNGRRDDRELAIYSQLALLRPNRKEVFCTPRTTAGRTCSTDTDALHRLISDWQTRLR